MAKRTPEPLSDHLKSWGIKPELIKALKVIDMKPYANDLHRVLDTQFTCEAVAQVEQAIAQKGAEFIRELIRLSQEGL